MTKRLGWAIRAHEGLADQDCVGAACADPAVVAGVADAAHVDRDAALRDALQSEFRGTRVDLERLEVARVDADDLGLGRQSDFDFARVGRFDYRCQAEAQRRFAQLMQALVR